MITFWNFIKALPALFALIQKIEKQIEEAGTARKVVEDVKVIHEAFDTKDAGKLNALFNTD